MRSSLLRSLWAAVLIWLAGVLLAQAQVLTGTSLYFDHSIEEQEFVSAYQLCVGGTDCRDVGVTRVGTTVTLSLTLPSWVPNGRRDFTVRAVWKTPLTGVSAPTNIYTAVVVGPPSGLRTTAVKP